MRKVAIIGGIGYLVIFFTGIFANFFVLEELKVVGDVEATSQNFRDNPSMIIWAIVAFVAMVVFDLVLTWVLYALFKEKQQKLSNITAWFRVINAVFFGVALVQLVAVLELSVSPLTTNVDALKLNSALEIFDHIWLIGLVFFGAHLILLSVLLCRSERVGKMIPLLLMIAGIGYIADTALQFGFSDYDSIAELSLFVVILPGIIGELSLTGWLLFKAGKQNNQKAKLTLRTAA